MATQSPPRRLRVDGRPEPLGTAHDAVTFGWETPAETQTAYRIRLATDSDPREAPDWDSGPVESGDSTAVPYAGPRLDSRTRYRWTVRVRDGDGDWTPWSDPAAFATGVTDWTADWLAPTGPEYETTPAPAPVFRTTFDVDRPVERARLDVAAGGTADPRLNGTRVAESGLDPAQTDYEERVLYTTYDVTEALDAGENALAVACGRERYAMTVENEWAWHDTPWQRPHPELSASLTLTFADGETRTIRTDDSWRVGPSATRFDSLYTGERYDAREAETWSDPGLSVDWPTAAVVDGPDGTLAPQTAQRVAPVREVAADDVSEPEPGVYVFDFGEQIAGWVRLAVSAPAGTELDVIHGETRHDDGTVGTEQDHLDAPFQTDTYVCAGGDETWEPRFTYKGFRYVQVEGLPERPDPDTLTGVVAHSTIEADSRSEFTATDERLNEIHDRATRALLSNHHGVPTDTPAYEKHGWTGDVQVTASTALYNFEMAPFYRKWLADCADAQRDTGELPPFAPTSDWGYSDGPHDAVIRAPNPAWDAAYVLVPWWTYRHTGDRTFLADHYEGMQALVRYLADFAEDGILDEGLGDWFPPGHGEPRWNPPEGTAITSTGYLYRFAEVLSDAADVLGRPRDSDAYGALADRTRAAFNDAFLDADAGLYATGETEEYRQTSNAFPLAFDMVPDEHRDAVVETLVANVRDEHDAHLDTGILGTRYLLGVLCDAGHTDLAYEVATQSDYPGWGYWIEQGETSMLETWELSARSHNHHMFGSVDGWFYEYLAGVRPAAPGYETVALEPHVPTGLDGVSATVDTPRGTVESAWERTEDGVEFEFRVPKNTEAVVRLPGSSDAPDSTATLSPGTWTFVTE
ncbi:MAG: family 78 glycoside hydrolase catalytic domain [Halobacteriaceae archaeon]